MKAALVLVFVSLVGLTAGLVSAALSFGEADPRWIFDGGCIAVFSAVLPVVGERILL